jgi:hypothetical protein
MQAVGTMLATEVVSAVTVRQQAERPAVQVARVGPSVVVEKESQQGLAPKPAVAETAA